MAAIKRLEMDKISAFRVLTLLFLTTTYGGFVSGYHADEERELSLDAKVLLRGEHFKHPTVSNREHGGPHNDKMYNAEGQGISGMGETERAGEGSDVLLSPGWMKERYDLELGTARTQLLQSIPAMDPGPAGRPCPCAEADWCKRVNRTVTSEVFSFQHTNQTATDYLKYDWAKLSTVVLVKHVDDDILCMAHQKNVRVVYMEGYRGAKLLDVAAREKWVKHVTAMVVNNFFDGYHLDFEDFVNSEPRRKALNALFTDVALSIRKHIPKAQVTIDVTHSPDVPHHGYDYVTLLKVADFAFLRTYDEPRHLNVPQCFAWAMDTNNITLQGVRTYEKLGIPSTKLLLGFGWYSFDFPCVSYNKGICHLKRTNGKCTMTGIATHSYTNIVKFLKENPSIRPEWDTTAEAHHFEYKDTDGTIRQVWYNDPRSLRLRYPLAAQYRLRGVGSWLLDTLDYSDTAEAATIRRDMFGELPYPKGDGLR